MSLKHYIGYILDDHNLFSGSLAKVLETYLPFEAVFTFSYPKDLIYHLMSIQTQKQVFLFLDYYIGDKTLPTVLSEINRVSKKHKIIVVSSITSPALLRELLTYKVDGIIHKSDNISDIIKCVQEVSVNNIYHTPNIQQILVSTKDTAITNPFSDREMELISYFVKGLTIEETAGELNLSPYTVATHRKRMFKKINCNNISELLAFARTLGIV